MKPSWRWLLAWIAVVCLLGSLAVEAGMIPASSFEKHSVAWPRESSCQSLRVLSGEPMRSRAGPLQSSSTSDVSLRADDLDPVGPPWLEPRGPPGRDRGPGRPVGLSVAKGATALIERVLYAPGPIFPAAGRPKLKFRVFQHPLAKLVDATLTVENRHLSKCVKHFLTSSISTST